MIVNSNFPVKHDCLFMQVHILRKKNRYGGLRGRSEFYSRKNAMRTMCAAKGTENKYGAHVMRTHQ